MAGIDAIKEKNILTRGGFFTSKNARLNLKSSS